VEDLVGIGEAASATGFDSARRTGFATGNDARLAVGLAGAMPRDNTFNSADRINGLDIKTPHNCHTLLSPIWMQSGENFVPLKSREIVGDM